MTRKIGKNRQEKFVKDATSLIKAHGGIHSTTEGIEKLLSVDTVRTFQPFEVFILRTSAGILALRVDDTESSLFSVFGKFADVQRATHITGGENNPHSGKWNFHYMDEVALLKDLDSSLCKVSTLKAITGLDGIHEGLEGDYEEVTMVFEGKLVTSTRLSVDDANIWMPDPLPGSPRGKNVIVVDGCSYLLSKKSNFQLILKNKRVSS